MPQLRFAPYRDIAREIAARLCAARDGRDALAPWAEEVIVPSRGVAEAVAAAVLDRMPRGVAGLQLHSLETLAQRTLAARGETPRVASDAERRLAMRTAVRGIAHPLMESRGIAAMLERTYRDVRDSARPAAHVRGASARMNLVQRAWSDYERLVGQLHVIDPSELHLRAAQNVAQVRPQILAGFYDMTGAQLALVEALLEAGRIAAIWVPADQPFAQEFVRVLARHAEVAGEPMLHIKAPHIAATQYETRFDELRGVCTHVAALLAAGTDSRAIGIVARSLEPYDARLLNRFARELGFRTTLGSETPLQAHRIGRGAMTLLRLRERNFQRADVLELVRDGLHARTRLDVDAVDAATRRARVTGGTSAELLTIRKRPPELDDYIALVKELEELTAARSEELLTMLEQVASLFRIESEVDLAAAEKLDAIAALFRRASVWNRPVDLAAVLDAIEHESLTETEPGGPVIWCGDVMRFRGRSFTHLFVVRMQDDVFPQRRTEDPLLPDSDRRTFGLREIGDGRAEEELLFALVSESAERVHFSYAAGDGFGKVLRPSRYLRGLVPEIITRGAEPARLREPAVRQLQLLVRAGTRSPFDGYLGARELALQSLSPTQLEDFGECPQKFLLKHLLGVEDLDRPERELQIEPREKGILDHRILERFYRATSAGEIAEAQAMLPRLPDALAMRLDAIIDEQFDELDAIAPPFNRTVRQIERRATKRLLREFLAADLADLAAQELLPQWFEYRFGAKHRGNADHPEPFIVDAGGVPVRVEGTIDRIDAGAERFRIVDYKSGKALRHQNLAEKIDRGVRLQLALYAMAVAEFFGASNVSGTIKPLVVGDGKAKHAFELREHAERVTETLHIFMTAIRNGVFPAFPNDRDEEFNSCKYCPVNHSCRTKHDADERRAVQQHEDPRTFLGGGAA